MWIALPAVSPAEHVCRTRRRRSVDRRGQDRHRRQCRQDDEQLSRLPAPLHQSKASER